MRKKGKELQIFLVGALTMLLITGFTFSVFAANYNQNINVIYRDIKIKINGNTILPKDANGNVVEPFIYNGTTYLPVRAVGEAVGYSVTWDQNTSTVDLIGRGSGGSSVTPSNPNTSTSVNLIDTYPPYAVSDTYWVKYYPSSGGESIQLGGKAYKNSLMIEITEYDTNYAMFNLGGRFSVLSGIAGELDQSESWRREDAVVNFYGDGTLIKTITVVKGNLPANFSLNVDGVSQLKIECVKMFGAGKIGFADLKLQ